MACSVRVTIYKHTHARTHQIRIGLCPCMLQSALYMKDMIKSSAQWYPVVVMIAVSFAFATINILLKKVIDDGLNHLVFITYRLSVSTLFLAPIGLFFERNSRPKITLSILFQLFISAIVGASLTQYLFLLGIQYTSATFACAFLNMVPVITFIMSLPFGLETLNLRTSGGRAKLIGSLLCVLGATLLTLYKGMPLFHHHRSNSHAQISQAHIQSVSRISSTSNRKQRWSLGSLTMIAGTLLWSSWYPLQSYVGKKYPCQYSSTAIIMFFGSIQSAVLCLSVDRNLSMWVLKGKIEIFSVIYAGMIGSGMCYVGMSWCVKKRGPVFTAAFSPLVQIMAAMFDIPILHEDLYLGSLLGSAVVIAGLYTLLWGKKKELQICSTITQDIEDIKIQDSAQLQANTNKFDSKCVLTSTC